MTLINAYPSVFSDTPGHYTVMQHDIELIPGTSIRQAPYRLHPMKKQQMKDVDYLLTNGLAIPSRSPWASSCLLVTKEAGQIWLCTDCKRVNSMTVPDFYPISIDDLINCGSV